MISLEITYLNHWWWKVLEALRRYLLILQYPLKNLKKPNKTIFTYATFSLEDEYDECPLSLGNDTITSSNKRLSLISNKGLFWPSVHYQSKTEETQKDNIIQEV